MTLFKRSAPWLLTSTFAILAACGGSSPEPTSTQQASAMAAPPAAPPAATPVIVSEPEPVAAVAQPAPPLATVSIAQHGAVCNGRFDNSVAIAQAIAAAKQSGRAVLIPAGVCAYGDVIRLDGVQLTGTGDGSVLHALDPNRQSIFMSGDRAAVRRVRLAGVRSQVRMAAWEATRITLFGATNFQIDDVTIDGASAAGIQTARGAHHGSITNSRIRDTLSDSIHITDRASNITVENNLIERSGDDGIAVVSYQQNGGMVDHVTARGNTVLNNRWGRQMSVVGGSNVLYENNRLENNLASAACLYVAQERGYATYGSHNVTLRHNSLRGCGGSSTGHGAVMLYSDGMAANTNITIVRNDIAQSWRGVHIFSLMNTGVTVDSNRVSTTSAAFDISTPGVTLIPYTAGLVGVVLPL